MPNGTYGGVRGQVNTKVGDKHPMISVYLLLDCNLGNSTFHIEALVMVREWKGLFSPNILLILHING